jgi:hypothetical protein
MNFRTFNLKSRCKLLSAITKRQTQKDLFILYPSSFIPCTKTAAEANAVKPLPPFGLFLTIFTTLVSRSPLVVRRHVRLYAAALRMGNRFQ